MNEVDAADSVSPDDPHVAELQRNLLPYLLLAEIALAPGHGYGLSLRLEERGLQRIKGARLYPTLTRLESDGLCRSTWAEGEGGPGRKIYQITEAGRDHLTALRQAWRQVSAHLDEMLAVRD